MLAGSHRNAWPDETGTGGRTNGNTQMVRTRFEKPVRLAVEVIKSGQKNCESWCFKEIIDIGFMVDEKWFGDDYLIINEAIFLSKIKRYRLRSCL